MLANAFQLDANNVNFVYYGKTRFNSASRISITTSIMNEH